MSDRPQDLPEALALVPEDRIVDCDVREDLRNGREPFQRIMAARKDLPEGGVLRIRAIFEPVPLYAVMAKQGLAHHTEKIAADDWRIWFYPGDLPARAPESPSGQVTPEQSNMIVLDVRGLEPPEPLVRTLEALETLPEGGALLQINVRVPQFLIPQLTSRGFTYKVTHESEDRVEVLIRRKSDD